MSGFSNDILSGKTILVAGAGKGIGFTCAKMAADLGAYVIAVARTESDLNHLKSASSGSIETWKMDVTSEEFLTRLSQLPTLDGLINNAGTNRVGLMQEQTNDNIDAVINLNIKTLYKVAQAAIKPMQHTDSASIVNMSSQMGFVGAKNRTLYCMSKHAVEGLTKAMAVELAENNIRVNTVAPTFVLTPMTEPMFADEQFKQSVFDMIPLKRLAKTQDIANSCIFLLSQLSTMITGTCIKVDGGWTAR